jgi:hypothetical protein
MRALLANMALAIWLLASSSFLKQTRPELLNADLCAVLAVASAVTGLLCGRSMRVLNVVVGLWLMLSATILSHATAAGAWNQGVVGYVLVMFAFIPERPQTISPRHA